MLRKFEKNNLMTREKSYDVIFVLVLMDTQVGQNSPETEFLPRSYIHDCSEIRFKLLLSAKRRLGKITFYYKNRK